MYVPKLLIYRVRNGIARATTRLIHYKSVLKDKLSVIDMSNDCLTCENVFCNNNDHANLIQQMHDDIISACIDASDNIFFN